MKRGKKCSISSKRILISWGSSQDKYRAKTTRRRGPHLDLILKIGTTGKSRTGPVYIRDG